MPTFYRKPNPETGKEDLLEVGTNRYIGPTEFASGAGFTEQRQATPVTPARSTLNAEGATERYAASPLQDFKTRNKLLTDLKSLIQKKHGNNADINESRQYWRTVQADPQSFVDPRMQYLSPQEQQSVRDYTQATAAARLGRISDEEKYRGDRMEDVLSGVKDIQAGKLDEEREARLNSGLGYDRIKESIDLGIEPTDEMYKAAGYDVRKGRIGASLSYINNNPGNLKYNAEWQKQYGAIKDKDSAFAVFPSIEKAYEAYKALLTSKSKNAAYKGLTPNEAMWKWSGSGKDTTPSYTYDDLVKLGAPAVSKSFDAFTDKEWSQFFEAQKKMEGWKEGTPVRGAKEEAELYPTDSEIKKLIDNFGMTESDYNELGVETYDEFNAYKEAATEVFKEDLSQDVIKIYNHSENLTEDVNKLLEQYKGKLSAAEITKALEKAGIKENSELKGTYYKVE